MTAIAIELQLVRILDEGKEALYFKKLQLQYKNFL